MRFAFTKEKTGSSAEGGLSEDRLTVETGDCCRNSSEQ